MALEGDGHRQLMAKQHQALVPSIFAPWILTVHFSIGSTVCYVCCLIPCMMFIFCVKEANWGMVASVAYFALWISEQYSMSFRMYHAQCNT